jgi:hypothetical protein
MTPTSDAINASRIGQKEHLSPGDITAINYLYCNGVPPVWNKYYLYNNKIELLWDNDR